MRITAKKLLLVSILMVSCSGKEDENKPTEVCPSETSVNYVQSKDKGINEETLTHFDIVSTSLNKSFEKTIPSGLPWNIKEKSIEIDSIKYSLEYSDSNNFWNVVGQEAAVLGNLMPFRTAECVAVEKFELTMFRPEETGTAHLFYMKL